MAATSPYSGNDYQAVSNFRPYELPINDIFKGISAQNAFWEAGAARVKSVYDNALNLKLSLEPNKEIRRKFIEDAEKQLTKLSSMDLSDPTVQRKGFSIFKPLFQDEGIIFDDLTTRHYEKVRNDALMFRNKDNGKGYSDINMQYAMQGYNEFVNSKDRMAGKTTYQNRKEYTPYYDYTEDFSAALKDCKASTVETQAPLYGKNNAITGYMSNNFAKTLSAAQVKGCLEAGLSPNAARQLQIEGAVGYRNHPEVLGSDVSTYLTGVGSNLSVQLQQLAAKKAALLKDSQGLTKEQLATVNNSLDQEIKATSSELDRNNNTVSKIQAGDLTDVLNNFESYAGAVHSYKKLYKKALASSFEEKRQMYKVDPVQLNHIKFRDDVYLKNLDFSYDVSLEQMKEKHDGEMKMLDLMYGGSGKAGKLTGGPDIFRSPLDGSITVRPDLMRETGNLRDIPSADDKAYEKVTKQVADLSTLDNNNNLRLYNNFIARGDRDKAFRETMLKGFQGFGQTEEDWTRFKNTTRNNRFTISREGNRVGGLNETSWFKAYMEQQPNDEDANKWASDHMTVNTGINTLNTKIQLGEKEVARRIGGDYRTQINESLNKLNPVNVGGIQITPQDIQDAIEGKSGKVSLQNNSGRVIFSTTGNLGSSMPNIVVNGQVVSNSELRNLYDKVNSENKSINNKLKSTRTDVYNQLGFDREPWFFTEDSDSRTVKTLQAILPKDDKGKAMDVSIISSDFSGGIKVAIPGVKKGSDDNPELQMLRDAGFGTSAEVTADGIVTIRGTTHNLIPQAANNPILKDAAYQLASIGETTAFNTTQDGAKVPNADIEVPVMISGKMKKLTIETFKDGTSPQFRVYVDGATDTRPLVVASNPYELFEKLDRARIDLNKPIK